MKQRSGRKIWKRIVVGIIFYVLLVVGIGLLLSPWLEASVIERAGRQYTSVGFSQEQLAANTAAREGFEIDPDITIPELPEILTNLPDINQDDVIGVVSIDSVGVFLPIFHGATGVNLLAGAGTMYSDQVMGEGNYPLAGHHMWDASLLFGPLLDVQIGDWIQLTDRQNLYTYQVTNTELIHQNTVEILEHTEEPTVTLFTCDVSNSATNNRWVVQGELIDVSPLDITIDSNGKLILQPENRGNPYLITFQTMNNIVIERAENHLIWRWIIIISGISFVTLATGMFLFSRIERRYQYIKRG